MYVNDLQCSYLFTVLLTTKIANKLLSIFQCILKVIGVILHLVTDLSFETYVSNISKTAHLSFEKHGTET